MCTSYKIVHGNVSKNSFSSIYSWIIYKRQQFQQPSDRLVQQSNHQTWGERPPFPPKCSLCFSKLHNCRVHLREEKWELLLRLWLVGKRKIQVYICTLCAGSSSKIRPKYCKHKGLSKFGPTTVLRGSEISWVGRFAAQICDSAVQIKGFKLCI